MSAATSKTNGEKQMSNIKVIEQFKALLKSEGISLHDTAGAEASLKQCAAPSAALKAYEAIVGGMSKGALLVLTLDDYIDNVHGGNKSAAARSLGCTVATIYNNLGSTYVINNDMFSSKKVAERIRNAAKSGDK